LPKAEIVSKAVGVAELLAAEPIPQVENEYNTDFL
jgi:hypothetical protein